MKLCFSIMLSLFFTLSASASTGAVTGLNQLLNEYQYSLTVEWDQKDPEVRKEITATFSNAAKELLRKNSLSREELLSVVKARVNSPKKLEALELKLALLPEYLSDDQKFIHLLDSIDSGAEGASWNGDVLAKGFAILLVSAMLLVIVNSIQQGKCVEESTELKTSCSDGDCYDYYPCLKRENDSWF